MDAEWSVAAGAEDPVLVVPWNVPRNVPCDVPGRDPDTAMHYIDLQADGAGIDAISEAREWPEIRDALLHLNAKHSRVWSAKCDAWILGAEEKALDFGTVAHGFGAYIDTIPHHRRGFDSLPGQISRAETLVASAQSLAIDQARAEFVIRPAIWLGREGYSMTLYVYGYGASEGAARSQWAEALRQVALLIAARVPSAARQR